MPRPPKEITQALKTATVSETTLAAAQLMAAYDLSIEQAYTILLHAKEIFKLRVELEKRTQAQFGSHHETITNAVDRHLHKMLDPQYEPPRAGGVRAGAGRKRKEKEKTE